MRRFLAALPLVLLLTRQAAAQTQTPPPPPPSAAAAAIAAQVSAQTSVETSYLLALYMAALANAGNPPSPSDIDEATRQYLTNGAAVTGVPGSGPGAAYFQNGAAVTSIPSTGPGAAYFHNGAEVLAYPAPRAVTPPEVPPAAPAERSPTAPSEQTPEEAGVLEVREDAAAAVASPPAPGPSAAPGLSLEGPPEAVATPALPPPPTISCAPCVTSSRDAARIPSTLPAELSAQCPQVPSPFARIATALGGALFGGLAVVLWSRPRAPRSNKRATAK